MPAHYDENGRDGTLVLLLLHELHRAQVLPLFAPLPKERQLANLCREFLEHPCIRTAPDEWARKLNKSPRTFTRMFRQQTGMSFSIWRQQACLLAALSRLLSGDPVTQVALELGYDSPSAFSTMFRKAVRQSPSGFVRASTQQEISALNHDGNPLQNDMPTSNA